MQIGLSGRAFVHFLIFELLLVGLLAMIGQVPSWLWFVASALLLAALWTHDHRMQLAALLRRTPPTRLVIVGLAAALTFMAGGGLLTFALLEPKTSKEPGPKAKQRAEALNQSLLSVMSVVTERRHDPLRLAITIANLGRLPTLKAFIGMDVVISEADSPPTQLIEKLLDTREHRQP
ncbi:MAG: hypothetical protein HC869_09830 [Rhodospirillales bacterium]|nr:hypothetical protein [Rhodospirillales bacterium]